MTSPSEGDSDLPARDADSGDLRLRDFPSVRRRDFVLDTLTSLVSKMDRGEVSPFRMTLVVSGLAISGTLIGAREYFEGLGRSMGEPETAEPGETRLFHDMAEELLQAARSDKPFIPSFIHLRSAKLVAGPGMVPTTAEGFLIRIQLVDVNAFAMGNVQAM